MKIELTVALAGLLCAFLTLNSNVARKTYGQQESVKTAKDETATSEPVEKSINTHMSLLFKPSYKRLKELMRESPKDAAGWRAIQSEALLLAESGGNLTARRDEAIGLGKDDYWMKNSKAVRKQGADLYNAAKEKNFEAATRSYRGLTTSCNACHRSHVLLGAPPILNPFGPGVSER